MDPKKAKLMLWKATETSKHDAIGKLLDGAVDVEEPLTDGLMNGLHLACAKGDKDSAQIYIDRGANVNARDGVDRTPLHFAAANGKDLELIELLVENGADVNAQSIGGDTPLMKAIMFDNVEAVEVLLDKGADPKIKNSNERDSESFARASRNPKILKALNLS